MNKKIGHRKQIARRHLWSTLLTQMFLTPRLIIMQNIFVFHTVCTHIGGPKNFGDAGAPLLWDGAWLTT